MTSSLVTSSLVTSRIKAIHNTNISRRARIRLLIIYISNTRRLLGMRQGKWKPDLQQLQILVPEVSWFSSSLRDLSRVISHVTSSLRHRTWAGQHSQLLLTSLFISLVVSEKTPLLGTLSCNIHRNEGFKFKHWNAKEYVV